AEIDAHVSERSARVDALVRLLPPAEAEIHQQRAELAVMRGRVETFQKELSAKRKAFAAFIDTQNRAMVTRAREIQTSFERHARDFLIEDCRLVWASHPAPVGQAGDSIEFHSFVLDMTGPDFESL